MFFDRDGKIYSVFMKNYIEKEIIKEDGWYRNVVSGNLDTVKSSDTGFVTEFYINRAYTYGYTIPVNDDLRTMDLNNIIGWVIKGENNAKHRGWRVSFFDNR